MHSTVLKCELGLRQPTVCLSCCSTIPPCNLSHTAYNVQPPLPNVTLVIEHRYIVRMVIIDPLLASPGDGLYVDGQFHLGELVDVLVDGLAHLGHAD